MLPLAPLPLPNELPPNALLPPNEPPEPKRELPDPVGGVGAAEPNPNPTGLPKLPLPNPANVPVEVIGGKEVPPPKGDAMGSFLGGDPDPNTLVPNGDDDDIPKGLEALVSAGFVLEADELPNADPAVLNALPPYAEVGLAVDDSVVPDGLNSGTFGLRVLDPNEANCDD